MSDGRYCPSPPTSSPATETANIRAGNLRLGGNAAVQIVPSFEAFSNYIFEVLPYNESYVSIKMSNVELCGSDCAFCFYAVYVQRRLLFTLRFFLLALHVSA
jgi:hypothetical protein